MDNNPLLVTWVKHNKQAHAGALKAKYLLDIQTQTHAKCLEYLNSVIKLSNMTRLPMYNRS